MIEEESLLDQVEPGTYLSAESMLATQLSEELRSRIDKIRTGDQPLGRKPHRKSATGVNMRLGLPPWNNEECHAIKKVERQRERERERE